MKQLFISFVGLFLLNEMAQGALLKKSKKVVILKSKRVLKVLNDKGKLILSFTISLGNNPKGHKQCEGDGKTPEGVYTIDYINEQSSYHRALHVTYPNANDKKKAEQLNCSPGKHIFIHGMRNGLGWLGFLHRYWDWTRGCIALTNTEMDQLIKLLQLPATIEIRP